MSDTFGQSYFDLSPSASLQRSLESRLLASLDVNGSPEFAMTWKRWAMKSGPPICALRASDRRSDDSGFIGRPTPKVADTSNETWETKQARNAKHLAAGKTKGVGGMSLPMAAMTLKAWSTPKVEAGRNRSDEALARQKAKGLGGCSNLEDQVSLTLRGWATPRARDHKNNGVSIARAAKGVADSLDLQCKPVCLSGTARPSPLSARMDRAAFRLNPIHSLWLMGYPSEWANFAEPATR